MRRTRARWAPAGLCLVLAGCAAAPDPTRMHFPPVPVSEPNLVEHTLPNGLVVHLLPDRKLPLIRIHALVHTGAVYDPPGKAGLAGLTGSLMREGGAGARDAAAFDEALASAAILMGSEIDTDAGTASLDTLTRTFPLALEAFADMLLRPRFEPDRLETLRAQAIEGVRRRNDRPAGVAGRLLRQTLYGPDHPYAREPTEASIQALSRDDVVAFHRRDYVPRNTVLGVSGDFDPDEMIAALTAAFGDWEDRPAAFADVPPVPETAARVVRFAHRPLDYVAIRIGEVTLRRDDPDFHAFALANGILGGQVTMNRLFAEVRTRDGLAYSVGSSYTSENRDRGLFVMGAGTRPENAAEAIRRMLAEAERLRAEPVPRAELDAAREAYLNGLVFSSVAADPLLRRMQLDYEGLPRDELERTRQEVLAATPEDLAGAVRTHLHPDRMAIVAVGDRAVLRKALAPFGTVEEVPLEAAGDAFPAGGAP